MDDKQPFFEDVEVGDELPPLQKPPISLTQLVMFCGITSITERMFFDREYAQQVRGLPDAIAPANLKFAWLAQFMVDWLGEQGELRKLGCQYRASDLLGDTITLGGRIAAKRIENSAHVVDCDLWGENQRGEKTTLGWATAVMPSRTDVRAPGEEPGWRSTIRR